MKMIYIKQFDDTNASIGNYKITDERFMKLIKDGQS